jgi:hypothetical protein
VSGETARALTVRTAVGGSAGTVAVRVVLAVGVLHRRPVTDDVPTHGNSRVLGRALEDFVVL